MKNTPIIDSSIDDLFKRQYIADFLYEIFTDPSIQCSPLLINGMWGVGKTVFCKDLIKQLENKAPLFKCVYIDAYEEGKIEDPILSISLVLSKYLDEENKINLIGYALNLSSFILKTSLNAISYKMTGSNFELSESGSSLIENFKQSFKSDFKKIKDLYEIKNSSIENLKSIVNSSNHKFIIFVDELDRCSPDYCLSFIEKIKYIFNEANIQFIIIANKNQITKYVETRYGHDTNTEEYISKYIKTEICIPQIYIENINNVFNENKEDVDESKNEDIIALNNFHSSAKYFTTKRKEDLFLKNIQCSDLFMHSIICKNSMSLRDVERILLYLSIYQKMTSEKQRLESRDPGYAKLVILFIVLSCIHGDVKNAYLEQPSDLKILKKIYNYDGDCKIHKSYHEGMDDFIDCIYENDPGKTILKNATEWYFDTTNASQYFEKYHFEAILSNLSRDLIRFPFLNCYSAICSTKKSIALPDKKDFFKA